ncbi:hypothetical protein [Pseudomonas mandelii]|nr:hypothetical protein [Pseudomonas mandelii]
MAQTPFQACPFEEKEGAEHHQYQEKLSIPFSRQVCDPLTLELNSKFDG